MKQNAHNGLFAWCLSPYVVDVHRYLKRKELKSKKIYFRSPQLKFRGKLIDWIRKVALKMKLSNTTVHLGIRLIDLFMDSHNIIENRLAPICLICLSVAAKYEEEDSKIPKIKDLTVLVKNVISKADFVYLELFVMESFDWCIGQVTAAHFAEYYILFAVVKGDVDHFGTPHHHLQDLVHSSMRDFLDLSLTDIYMNKFMSSKVAASCLLAARLEHGVIPVWPKALADVTGYSLTSLQQCLDLLMDYSKAYERSENEELMKIKEDPRFDSGYESCSPDNAFKKRILSRR